MVMGVMLALEMGVNGDDGGTVNENKMKKNFPVGRKGYAKHFAEVSQVLVKTGRF